MTSISGKACNLERPTTRTIAKQKSRFTFQLATPDDSEQLLELMAHTPMPGAISLRFDRAPDYFGASAIDGDFLQVIAARDNHTGRVIGMASRAISHHFVNGELEPVGYLSALRILPQCRGQAAILARGYRFLRELHSDGRAKFYLTAIASDNDAAIGMLTSGRAGLPIYSPIANIATQVFRCGTQKQADKNCSWTLRQAEYSDRAALIKFVNDVGSRRQFFPHVQDEDWFTNHGRFAGLKVEDFVIAQSGDRIVGAFAAWDQKPFKQVIVDNYSRATQYARPAYNILAALFSQPNLPPAGTMLPTITGALLLTHENAPIELAWSMISAQRARYSKGNLLSIGTTSKDTRRFRLNRKFLGIEYQSRLFVVHWPEDQVNGDTFANETIHVELGLL